MTPAIHHLLLHVCCAPCATHPIRQLSSQFDLAVFFYNPNIQPETEYIQRQNEIERLLSKWGVPFIRQSYDAMEWFSRVRGHENDAEGEIRCSICFQMRLDRTAQFAMENGFTHFTTTLTLSPHKNAKEIHEIGFSVAKMHAVTFLPFDFKKKNGFQIATRISREEGLYRQNYCGCLYSLRN